MNAFCFEQFLEAPGRPYLSPNKVATRLAMQLGDLAASAHVHRNTLRAHPESPKVQSLLRNIVRAISAAEAAFGDRETAIAWLMNEPIPAFRHVTAYAQ